MGSGWGGALYDISKVPALAGPQPPGARADQHTRSHFLSAHYVVPKIVPVHFHGCYLCLCLNVYFSERESGRNPVEDALRKALFLIWQNLKEHAQDWLATRLLCLFFIVLMYVTVNLAGDNGESKC